MTWSVDQLSSLIFLWCSANSTFKHLAFLFFTPTYEPEDTKPHIWGAGIAQWLERRTRDRKVPGSSPSRSGGRFFFSRVSFLCWFLFRYVFHPRVTAVARKRSRSFCQKCRWQVTAKHTYTLRMWLWMKWHCNLVHGCMVYTELAPKQQHFTWHQPCNNQRALPVHHFRGY